jgi:hypothetical protein
VVQVLRQPRRCGAACGRRCHCGRACRALHPPRHVCAAHKARRTRRHYHNPVPPRVFRPNNKPPARGR